MATRISGISSLCSRRLRRWNQFPPANLGSSERVVLTRAMQRSSSRGGQAFRSSPKVKKLLGFTAGATHLPHDILDPFRQDRTLIFNGFVAEFALFFGPIAHSH